MQVRTGPSAARTATFSSDSAGRVSSVSQTNGSTTRSVGYTYSDNNLTKITDAEGKATSFGYTGRDLTSITNPDGKQTLFAYDSSKRITSITQKNAATGSPGDSVTRLAYPTFRQTLLASPNTDQATAVASVPRTTYNLSVEGRVSDVTDAAGRVRSRTYTANFDTLTDVRDTGSAAATTTNTYGANSGESQTKSTAPTGAAEQAAYANTAAASKYLPSDTTDDANNKTTYTYNGAGNTLTSTDSTAAAAKAEVTYNSNGTVATAIAPTNAATSSTSANPTSYGYTNGQLTSITPPTGTTLGSRALTYDDFGRLKTTTNGRSVTATYTYDKLDRITKVSFSGGSVTTADTTYTYDAQGRTKTRVDASGTTTYGYDDIGRLTSRANTAAGGTISYGYDKASHLTAKTDTRGTTTYEFDNAGVPTKMNYTSDGATRLMVFETDTKGRRTGTWMQSNATHTVWKARMLTEYTSSGRVKRVTADSGEGDTNYTRQVDLTYCYAVTATTTTTSPTCSSTTTDDRSKIQWVKNGSAGEATYYTYDKRGRLLTAKTVSSSTTKTYTYTYDANGNRKTAASTGGTTQTLTYNAGNQITTSGYSHDGTGNMTARTGTGTLTYNGAEQMTKVVNGSNTYDYTYAGPDQREVTKQVGPTATYDLVYGRTDSQALPVVEQYTRSNASSYNGTAYVEHDPVTGDPLLLRTSSGLQSMYVYDANRNPITLLTSGAAVSYAYKFDPYGTPDLTSTSGGNGVFQNPYLFATGIQDRATGFVKFGQRWYNPADGRWTQQDTLDAPLDPRNANRYAYAGDDPINNLDPTGNLTDPETSCLEAQIGALIASLGVIPLAISAAGGPLALLAVIGYGWAIYQWTKYCRQYF